MSITDISKAVRQLRDNDPLLRHINLINRQHTDEELAELADCLITHPNAVTVVYLMHNQLTDVTGVKLAQYLAVSSTIQVLDLSYNQFGEATYLALAAALCVNTSLWNLNLFGNLGVDQTRIDAAFVDALILNRNLPQSEWLLYSYIYCDFNRLKTAAEQLGHPNMQALLATQLVRII